MFGMMRVIGKIQLAIATQAFGASQGEVKNLLYDLAGQNLIEGRLEGPEFVITSDTKRAMEDLKRLFAEWTDKEAKQVAKV